MVNEKEVLEDIHFQLHIARQLRNNKPSNFELKVSYLISDFFENKCSECKQVLEQKRVQAENQIKGNIPQQQNFIDKFLGR